MARKLSTPLPPDVQAQLAAEVKRYTERKKAGEEMARWANEAKRLHDSGDLKGARKALKQAERWRAKFERLSASPKPQS